MTTKLTDVLEVQIHESVHNMVSIEDKIEYCLIHIVKIARENTSPNAVMRDHVYYIKSILSDTIRPFFAYEKKEK
jgi:hypothetical protein